MSSTIEELLYGNLNTEANTHNPMGLESTPVDVKEIQKFTDAIRNAADVNGVLLQTLHEMGNAPLAGRLLSQELLFARQLADVFQSATPQSASVLTAGRVAQLRVRQLLTLMQQLRDCGVWDKLQPESRLALWSTVEQARLALSLSSSAASSPQSELLITAFALCVQRQFPHIAAAAINHSDVGNKSSATATTSSASLALTMLGFEAPGQPFISFGGLAALLSTPAAAVKFLFSLAEVSQQLLERIAQPISAANHHHHSSAAGAGADDGGNGLVSVSVKAEACLDVFNNMLRVVIQVLSDLLASRSEAAALMMRPPANGVASQNDVDVGRLLTSSNTVRALGAPSASPSASVFQEPNWPLVTDTIAALVTFLEEGPLAFCSMYGVPVENNNSSFTFLSNLRRAVRLICELTRRCANGSFVDPSAQKLTRRAIWALAVCESLSTNNNNNVNQTSGSPVASMAPFPHALALAAQYNEFIVLARLLADQPEILFSLLHAELNLNLPHQGLEPLLPSSPAVAQCIKDGNHSALDLHFVPHFWLQCSDGAQPFMPTAAAVLGAMVTLYFNPHSASIVTNNASNININININRNNINNDNNNNPHQRAVSGVNNSKALDTDVRSLVLKTLAALPSALLRHVRCFMRPFPVLLFHVSLASVEVENNNNNNHNDNHNRGQTATHENEFSLVNDEHLLDSYKAVEEAATFAGFQQAALLHQQVNNNNNNKAENRENHAKAVNAMAVAKLAAASALQASLAPHTEEACKQLTIETVFQLPYSSGGMGQSIIAALESLQNTTQLNNSMAVRRQLLSLVAPLLFEYNSHGLIDKMAKAWRMFWSIAIQIDAPLCRAVQRSLDSIVGAAAAPIDMYLAASNSSQNLDKGLVQNDVILLHQTFTAQALRAFAAAAPALFKEALRCESDLLLQQQQQHQNVAGLQKLFSNDDPLLMAKSATGVRDSPLFHSVLEAARLMHCEFAVKRLIGLVEVFVIQTTNNNSNKDNNDIYINNSTKNNNNNNNVNSHHSLLFNNNNHNNNNNNNNNQNNNFNSQDHMDHDQTPPAPTFGF